MSHMLLRRTRLLLCISLISLVLSLLPPALSLPGAHSQALAHTSVALPLAVAAAAATPPEARSTDRPASYADEVRAQEGATHAFGGFFDGDFGTASQVTTVINGPITLAVPQNDGWAGGALSTTLTLPAGMHHHLLLDATTQASYRDGVGNANAYIAFRVPGAERWSLYGGNYAGSAVLTGVSSSVTNKSITLGNAASPYLSALEVLLFCQEWSGHRNGVCTFSNLRFADDVPGWWLENSGPVQSLRLRVGAASANTIPTALDGNFLSMETVSPVNVGTGFAMRTPPLQLPLFSSSTPLTVSLQWSRRISGTGSSGPGFNLYFRALDGQSSSLIGVASGGSTGWTIATATVNPALAGKPGYLELVSSRQEPQVLGIDSIRFWLNGRLITLPLAVPPDQMAGKCVCDAGGRVQVIYGDPVNTASGAFYIPPQSDLVVASGGPALTLERSYVSLFAGSGYPVSSLGPGWRHSFEATLSTADGVLIYEAPSGNRLRFTQGANGNYYPAPGVYAQLSLANGIYTLTLRDQSVERFDSNRRLIERRTPQGQLLTLSYYSSGNGNGRVAQVLDQATQRRLSFTYYANGRLESVRDDQNRVVRYTYSSNNDLQTVTDVRGGVTTYSYQGSPRRLVSMQDALGVTQVVNTYDAQGRVVRQVAAHGLTTNYTYTPTNNGWATTITQQRAGVTLDTLVDHYRPDGTLEYQEQNGRFRSFVTFDANLSPLVAVDGNGQRQRLQTNAAGLPLVIRNALGQQMAASYDERNRPRVISDTLGRRSELRYDADNNLLRQTTDITGTFPGFTTIYTYTNRRLSAQQGPDGVVTRYARLANGEVLTTTVGYGTPLARQWFYGYDVLGRVITVVEGYQTPLQRSHVTRYNPDGSVAATIRNWNNGTFDPARPDEDVITTYGYDALGRQIWTRDVLGRYTATAYDSAGRVTWTVRNLTGYSGGALPNNPPPFDPARPDTNVATFYGYDGLGRTVLITETGILTGTFDPIAQRFSAATRRVTHTEYDALSRPVTVTLNYQPGVPPGPDVNVQTLTYYDGAGNVIWQRDALNRWTRTEHDALNRPITVTLNYENGDPTTIDPANRDWASAADTDIVSVSRYNADGQLAWTIENFVNGLFDEAEPSLDRRTVYHYDAIGRLVQTVRNVADGNETTGDTATDQITATAYDAAGRVQGTRTVLGTWISQQYDALGQVVATVQNCRNAAGQAVPTGCAPFDLAYPDRNVRNETRYDALGRVIETVDPLGVITQQSYNGIDQLVATTRNVVVGAPPSNTANITTRQAYTALSQTTIITDALGAVTTTASDALGRTVVMTDALGRVTQMGVDATGSPRWTRSPDGRFTVTQVDGLGRVIATLVNYQDGVVAAQEPPDQDLITRSVYDAGGRQVQTVDAAGQVTRFGYDLRDRLVQVIENVSDPCLNAPCNVITTYAYDPAGYLLSITDARGITTHRFLNDAAGRPQYRFDGLERETRMLYDRAGQVLRTIDPRGAAYDLSYGYDEMGRLRSISAVALAAPIQMHYDARGQRRSLIDATGTTSFRYDALGRMIEVTAPATGRIGYTYDAAGQRSGLSYPDGTTLTMTYARDGQLETVRQGSRMLAHYAYDAVGRLAMLSRENAVITQYAYDGADRLVDHHTQLAGGTRARFQYTLDRSGQRTAVQEELDGASRTLQYTYDGLRRLSGATEQPGASVRYHYDLAGNRTALWRNGVLIQAAQYDAANQVVGWQYDAAGNLLSDGLRSFTYDALNRLVARDGTTTYAYTGDGVLVAATTTGTTTRYTHDLAAPLSHVLNDGSANYVYGRERVAAERNGTHTWYLGDALGSVRAILDDRGAVQATVRDDPWGVPQGTTIAPFGFTGELHDPASGLVYLRARWYDPGRGVFAGYRWETSESNNRRPYSHHPYAYALGNPVNYTDPTGKCVPQFVTIGGWQIAIPGGEPGCEPIDLTQADCIPSWVPGIGQSGCESLVNLEDGLEYAWDLVEGAGSPGAWLIDQFAGTNGWECIWQDASIGTQLGGAFTTIVTSGVMYKHVVVPLAQRAAALLASATTVGGTAIARYTPSDAKALTRFAREAAAYNGGRGRTTFPWEALVKQPGEVIVYKSGGRIVGAMRVQQTSFRGKPVLSIEEVESIQTGVGRILLRSAAERVLRDNLAGLTGLPDAQALRLYQRYGAQEVGLGRYYLDAAALRRLLTN